MVVVPTPVVIFTHADAVRAAQMTPAVMKPDHENVMAVGAMTNLEQMSQKLAQMVITHHSESKRTKKKKVDASWVVMVAIEGTPDPHVFRVVWPDEENKPEPDNLIILPQKGPVVAHA